MKNLRNRVQLIGNLGSDPDIKEVGNDKVVAKLSLATNETYKNSDGDKVTETQWHNLVAWGNNARFAENYLKKGQNIAVEGKLQHSSYNDKEGQKRYVTEVVVNEILMLRSK